MNHSLADGKPRVRALACDYVPKTRVEAYWYAGFVMENYEREECDEILGRPGRWRRPRRPSVASLIRQAEKGGKTVNAVTLPDGTILTFGSSTTEHPSNTWDEVLNHAEDPKRPS